MMYVSVTNEEYLLRKRNNKLEYTLIFLNIIKDFCLLKIIKFLQFTGVCIYKEYLYLVKVI